MTINERLAYAMGRRDQADESGSVIEHTYWIGVVDALTPLSDIELDELFVGKETDDESK